MFTKNECNMGAIRLIQKPQNGQIIINVPDEMRDEAIIIEFRPAREEQSTVPNPGLAEASKAFFEKLPAPDPTINWDEINVYEQ